MALSFYFSCIKWSATSVPDIRPWKQRILREHERIRASDWRISVNIGEKNPRRISNDQCNAAALIVGA